MKAKLFILGFLVYVSIAKSQITLENSYPVTSNNTGLWVVNLSNSGYKYAIADYVNHNLKLYNLNHSLWKTISLSVPVGYTMIGIGNVSETLFNLDGLVELTYGYYKTTPTWSWQYNVINESGSVLLSLPNCSGMAAVNTGTNGWKLLVTMDTANTASMKSHDVYSLVGTMPFIIKSNTHNNNAQLSNPVPNPSQDRTTITYQLPIGTNSGEVVFYNLNGIEVRRFKVDNSFQNLELDNSDLPSGTYYYHLIYSGNTSPSKKMIVIN